MQTTLTRNATSLTTGRPSLYNNESARQAGGDENGSILGQLESARPRIKAPGLLIAASILAVLGLVAWLMMQGREQAGVPVIAIPVTTPAQEASVAIAAAPTAASEARLPAQIVLDTANPASPVSVARQDERLAQADSQVAHEQSLSAREELMSAPATALQPQPQPALAAPGSAAAATPAIADKARSAPASAPPSDTSRMAAAIRPVTGAAAAEKPQAAGATKPATSVAIAKNSEKDGDVELIAALLNRVSSKTDVPADEGLRKSRPEEARKATALTAPRKTRKGAVSRDTVVATKVDTAQVQLERCNALGFFEAEMCRLRTCSGRWGSDPGCPEYAQNNNGVP